VFVAFHFLYPRLKLFLVATRPVPLKCLGSFSPWEHPRLYWVKHRAIVLVGIRPFVLCNFPPPPSPHHLSAIFPNPKCSPPTKMRCHLMASKIVMGHGIPFFAFFLSFSMRMEAFFPQGPPRLLPPFFPYSLTGGVFPPF